MPCAVHITGRPAHFLNGNEGTVDLEERTGEGRAGKRVGKKSYGQDIYYMGEE